jgi:hypothetical protein
MSQVRHAQALVIPSEAGAVGMGITPDPPHRSVQALASAYGSYLGYERQSVAPAKDAGGAGVEAIVPAVG